MLFPTTAFAVFFLVVFVLHWTLVTRPAAWKWFVLASSWFFYGFWDWRFVGLLALSTILNHALAVAMGPAGTPRPRRFWMACAVVFNLGMLGYFKYYQFFNLEIAYPVFAALGLENPLPYADIILPVGISFFTFQAMSYVIDVYRGVLPPARSTLDFGIYLAFFPQLVAGPIVRAVDLLPQMETPPARRAKIDIGRAALLILGGLFKKIVIANFLASQVADPVFRRPDLFGAADTVLGVFAYAIQIYCDFSAYSDIAIGVALLLGFHFPINFNAPYFATSLQDFWRRWHISLSTWLRDYLYIPLGGSRFGTWSTYRNLLLTFLLGGLWHGAGWTFIVWGAIHGAYLSLERAAGEGLARLGFRGVPGPLGNLVRQVWIFLVVCLTWIFFRSQTFDDARMMLHQLGDWSGGMTLWNGTVGLALATGFAMQFLDGRRMARAWDALSRLPAWVLAVLAALALAVILALGPAGVAPFIYFQF